MDKYKKEEKQSTGCMDQLGGMGIGITSLVMILTIVSIFMIVKYFFYFICGAIINGGLYGTYRLGKYIALEAQQNNYKPLKWFLIIFGFIVLSIIFGYYLSGLEYVNSIYDGFVNNID